MIPLDVGILPKGDRPLGLSSLVCRSADILKIGDRECMVHFEQGIISKERNVVVWIPPYQDHFAPSSSNGILAGAEKSRLERGA
jgi:hypothetical protein